MTNIFLHLPSSHYSRASSIKFPFKGKKFLAPQNGKHFFLYWARLMDFLDIHSSPDRLMWVCIIKRRSNTSSGLLLKLWPLRHPPLLPHVIYNRIHPEPELESDSILGLSWWEVEQQRGTKCVIRNWTSSVIIALSSGIKEGCTYVFDNTILAKLLKDSWSFLKQIAHFFSHFLTSDRYFGIHSLPH